MSVQSIMGCCPKNFISANSKNGFFSLYEEVFRTSEFDRIYVIFGGPGTGKSTLLRGISAKAKENGVSVEEIACSSDPCSLDGVILNGKTKRIGVFDGTPPHGRIITSPALCEETIDLGAFWDAKELIKQKETILSLCEKKKRAYARAYALLCALGSLWEERRIVLLPSFDTEKAKRQIKHKIGIKQQGGVAEYRLMRSYSGNGEIVLPICEEEVQNFLFIGGDQASAEIYLTYFEKNLQKLNVDRTVFLSPLDGKNVDGIYLKNTKTFLLKESLKQPGKKGRRIVADRFFTSSAEQTKEHRACFDAIKSMALSALKEAKAAHTAIEEYYMAVMDFEALGKFRERKTEEILSLVLE